MADKTHTVLSPDEWQSTKDALRFYIRRKREEAETAPMGITGCGYMRLIVLSGHEVCGWDEKEGWEYL